MTKRSDADPYGCANKSRSPGHWAKAGIAIKNKKELHLGEIGIYRMTYVEDRMSIECRYDQSLSDPRCGTCRKRGDGEKYDFEIRSKGR